MSLKRVGGWCCKALRVCARWGWGARARACVYFSLYFGGGEGRERAREREERERGGAKGLRCVCVHGILRGLSKEGDGAFLPSTILPLFKLDLLFLCNRLDLFVFLFFFLLPNNLKSKITLTASDHQTMTKSSFSSDTASSSPISEPAPPAAYASLSSSQNVSSTHRDAGAPAGISA